MEPKFLTPCELAERWRVTEGALSKWRNGGIGPCYIKLGHGARNAPVRYPLEEIERLERENSFSPIRKP